MCQKDVGGRFPVDAGVIGPMCTTSFERVGKCVEKARLCDQQWQGRADGDTPDCNEARYHCTRVLTPFLDLNVNSYDLRLECKKSKDHDRSDKENYDRLCYKEMGLMNEWLNRDDIKARIGLEDPRKFTLCHEQAGARFRETGEGGRNNAKLLPHLLRNDVRVLSIAGMTDAACNYMGIEAWMDDLRGHPYQNNFQKPSTPWIVNGEHVGLKRIAHRDGSAATGAGGYNYVAVENAGHMVPHDQGKLALALVESWVNDQPLPTNLP